MDMMQGRKSRAKHTPEEMKESGEREEISFFPLAVPMLAGPGAITTAIVLMKTAETIPFKVIVLISIIFTFLITGILFRMSEQIHRVLGVTGSMVITRMMGLIYLRCNSSSIHYEGIVGYFFWHYNRVVLDKIIIFGFGAQFIGWLFHCWFGRGVCRYHTRNG
jgi:MarC family membrane protein